MRSIVLLVAVILKHTVTFLPDSVPKMMFAENNHVKFGMLRNDANAEVDKHTQMLVAKVSISHIEYQIPSVFVKFHVPNEELNHIVIVADRNQIATEPKQWAWMKGAGVMQIPEATRIWLYQMEILETLRNDS